MLLILVIHKYASLGSTSPFTVQPYRIYQPNRGKKMLSEASSTKRKIKKPIFDHSFHV